MRLFWIYCLLFASAVTALPNGRHKRDLSAIRNWITTAIFGKQQLNIQPKPTLRTENEYKLYRLPAFDEEIIKVIPRASLVKEFVYPELKPVNLNAFGSVVGTKSNKDTLVAVKKVNNLLRTGILHGNHNNVLKESISPMFPTLSNVNYVATENIKPILSIQKRPLVLKEEIKPYEERIEVEVPFEPKYSYKQTKNQKAVMTYTAHTNPYVKVVETALPMCVKERIDKVIELGANPNRLALGQEVYRFQASPFVNTVHDSIYRRILPERLGTVVNSRASPRRDKDSHIRHTGKPIKSQPINPSPVPLYSHSSDSDAAGKTTPSKSSFNLSTGETYAFTNLGNKIELSRTLGPVPSQYMARNESGLPKRTKVNQMNAATIVATKDNISNGMIPDSVYNYQNNPNTGKTVKKDDALKTDVKTNTNYYFIPSEINKKAPNMQITKEKDGAFINNVTVNSQSVILPATSSSRNVPKEGLFKENDFIFYKGNPTAVPDVKTYSYKKKNIDGSSLSIIGNKNGVVVDVKQGNIKNRGDIPDEQEQSK